LNSGGYSPDWRLAHEYDESAETDGGQCRIAEKSDHCRIDDVQQVLRYHAPNDGQGQAKDPISSRLVHADFFFRNKIEQVAKEMTWISTISYDDAAGTLQRLYDRVKGPDNNVDNVMLAHSLRPHSMEGHMALYKNVLHHPGNVLAKSFLETIGVYVSLLNQCQYCVAHHFAGMSRLLSDGGRAAKIRAALEERNPGAVFSGRELCGLQYAEKLTIAAATTSASDIEALRKAGFDDGEILEINQVTAYFGYANRMVLGLGINTRGDIIGLSPGDASDPDNWSHR